MIMNFFLSLVHAGGWVVILLLLLAIFLLAMTGLKLWQFIRAGLFSRQGKVLQKLQQQTELLIKQEKLSIPVLEDEVTRLAQQQLSDLRAYLRPIEVIASLAPLIGLLGTVLGIIEAFQAMEAAGTQVNPSVLSGGIWKALLTTAVGLCVAIPATFVYNYLDSKVEQFAQLAQDQLSALINHAQMHND